jgi:putative ABC transport system substrate-binding protein
MRRRNFITLLSGAATAGASPLLVRAQQPERMRRIGLLIAYAEADPDAQARMGAFTRELEALGWANGRNMRFKYRWAAGDTNRFRAYAAELVSLQCDVILAVTTPATSALQHDTRTIPIVFVMVSDPEGSGVVASLARPGGNVTGLTNFEPTMGGKWLGLVKEIAPDVKRVNFMFSPERFPARGVNFLCFFETAGHSLATEPIAAPVNDSTSIEDAMRRLGGEPGGGLVVAPDSLTVVHRDPIVSLAAHYGIPAIYPYRFFVTAGGLMSYGTDIIDLHRRVTSYVDRILHGAKPADLPVQGPVKFELVVNQKAAKALNLTIPSALLALFPSRTDTFGLVLLEARVRGLPVAAFPAVAPLDVIGEAAVAALNTDLRTACVEALELSRQRCRDFALGMTWRASAQAFLDVVQTSHTAWPVPYAA